MDLAAAVHITAPRQVSVRHSECGPRERERVSDIFIAHLLPVLRMEVVISGFICLSVRLCQFSNFNDRSHRGLPWAKIMAFDVGAGPNHRPNLIK